MQVRLTSIEVAQAHPYWEEELALATDSGSNAHSLPIQPSIISWPSHGVPFECQKNLPGAASSCSALVGLTNESFLGKLCHSSPTQSPILYCRVTPSEWGVPEISTQEARVEGHLDHYFFQGPFTPRDLPRVKPMYQPMTGQVATFGDAKVVQDP